MKTYGERRQRYDSSIELIKPLSTSLASLQNEMDAAMVDVREGKRMQLNTRLITLEELPQQIDTLEAQGNHYEQ